jgi:nitronate monooxygenase
MGVTTPIASAPMGGSAGGALAAAVSNGGGYGMVGGGRGEPAWVTRELAIVAKQTDRPWGVGFLSWSATPAVVDQAIEQGPTAVMLSFGDPGPLARQVRAGGVRLILQVTDLEEARRAVDLGADVIVVQGSEAGGHSGRGWSTLPFVPIVVDLAGNVPVLAAGGIADGRGVAAALALGAAGAMLGTRFQVTGEALVDPADVAALLAGSGESTERTRLADIARGAPWPSRYPARMLHNAFLEEWRGREAELGQDEASQARYREAEAARNLSVAAVWASSAIDLITEPLPAADLVRRLASETEAALRQASRALADADAGPALMGEVVPEGGRGQDGAVQATRPTEGAAPERWAASSQHPDMWVDPTADPREALPDAVDERTTLVQFLAGYRLTMEMKCAGLDPEQMARRSVPPSTMTLLGLVRHMAGVERYWFRRVMAAEDVTFPYRTAGDRDMDWNGAVADPDVVAEAWSTWRHEVAFAEHFVEQAEDLGMEGRQRDGTPIQLRAVLVHMVEEYARHCGHADLLRERIDGRVGQ